MQLKNQIFEGANRRKTVIDVEIPEKHNGNIALFIHGYKGYKDWGAWNLVQDFFVEHNIGFAKLNLSHNGGTVDDPIDFPDLEAFGKNCYSYEIEDIHKSIHFLDTTIGLKNFKLHLIGHSRGGGDVILAGSHPKISKIITWAAIDDIASRFPSGEELKKWKKESVRYVKNGRTKQNMPHYYSFYEDFIENRDKFDIKTKAQTLNKPCLHIHGDKDEAVNVSSLKNLSKWTNGETQILKNTGHTFDTKHPWEQERLPDAMLKVCKRTANFINC